MDPRIAIPCEPSCTLTEVAAGELIRMEGVCIFGKRFRTHFRAVAYDSQDMSAPCCQAVHPFIPAGKSLGRNENVSRDFANG